MSRKPFMCYYEHIAKLSQIANKQTMFLAHLLSMIEYDSDTKQTLVILAPHDKIMIMKSIGCESKNMLNLANQYLRRICESGLIKSIGRGAYLVDPSSYSYAKYIPQKLRQESSHIYETRVFSSNDEGIDSAYIITEDGERIDLT